ncbi:lysophospholipid acyltransferase family protein [Amycolatopsis marina]|uniref:lysophospholipid acyltransferase family protein n=1 Tax=Amycolatopsis marina TaxID=490629 RepID=UPI001FEAF238|nr:lysophospholipid acyltransferase family protein [Amycolatopsis marina]
MKRWVRLAGALAAAAPASARGEELGGHARRVLDALDVRLEAPEHRLSVPGSTGTLLVANHISWLDIVGLLAVEPAAFLAKREVADWPVFGPMASRMGTLFLDREALRALPDGVARLAALLRSGRSVVVFPEGTTWCSAPGGQFRRAAFQAALDAGAPVRPLTISYREGGVPSTIAAFVGDDTLAASLHRVASARDLTLRIDAHPVLLAAGDRRSLAVAAQRAATGERGGLISA